MSIRSFEDLQCWQLANELKIRVYELLDRSKARSDVRFCDQITDAAASGPANLAEAFGCFRHPDSARYARIAKSSLTETRNHVLDGIDRKHWSAEHAAPALTLTKRALGATVKWIRYLETTNTPGEPTRPGSKRG